MQLSFDSRRNSVPTILLLLQKRLNAQGRLEVEGIFEINAKYGQEDNVLNQLSRGMLPADGIGIQCLAGLIKCHSFRSFHRMNAIIIGLERELFSILLLEAEEIFEINAEYGQEYVQNQLSRGMLPDGIGVHCLEGLIKAWFRKLPIGVSDSLSSEQVMQSQCEEDYSDLVKFLPSTEAALLAWAINLIADIVQHEHLNKMNSHNIAMVFAPNVTQMADPLTAWMYEVQAMNFLKTLIERALGEREDSVVVVQLQPCHFSDLDYSDDKSHHLPSQLLFKYNSTENNDAYSSFISEVSVSKGDSQSDSTSIEGSFEDCETRTLVSSIINGEEGKVITGNKVCVLDLIGQTSVMDITRELSNLSRIKTQ